MTTRTETHEGRLLEYLKARTRINPLEAWAELGIYRLSAVVFALRQKGHDIKTNIKPVLNRFDEPCNFAEYELQPRVGT
jgi:hypothetical protein